MQAYRKCWKSSNCFLLLGEHSIFTGCKLWLSTFCCSTRKRRSKVLLIFRETFRETFREAFREFFYNPRANPRVIPRVIPRISRICFTVSSYQFFPFLPTIFTHDFSRLPSWFLIAFTYLFPFFCSVTDDARPV